MSELRVLHACNHLLVVDKPACVPTVPDSSGDESLFDSAKAWIAREYHKPGAVFLGVVQRLDRPVSGVICFARTSKAADRLTSQLKSKRMGKTYWALCGPWVAEDEGELRQWLVKNPSNNRVTSFEAPRDDAKEAITRWRVRERRGETTWLELEPITGRPHQLRVAAASLGAPLLGDLKYGATEALPDKSVALHARALVLEHPTLRESMRFEAEPPKIGPWRQFAQR
ncbi:RluA family pseudouridine synthase [Engelhardtia mirabilis]|uniref:Ribosomal large subunit pseudouridine synthase C n=1 Tax=Engelhardtia mirabilis TaxID=2528011 RepID=A0A518BMU1_9BACT|nr:Ribosomal large subunit pseudouridine synthase C [Planctomycetes bacterium Pla133]QDV02628.1 Ribosomal large subunit pseudouridine synthase C [Planctomycetes bacterium Pla86]